MRIKPEKKDINHSQIDDIFKDTKTKVFERSSHYYDNFYFNKDVNLWVVGTTRYAITPRKQLYKVDDLNLWFQEILDNLALEGNKSGRFQWSYIQERINPTYGSPGYTWNRGIDGIRIGFAAFHSSIGTSVTEKKETYTFCSDSIRDADMLKKGFINNNSESILIRVSTSEPKEQEFVEAISIVPYLSEKHFDEESTKDKKDFENLYYPFKNISRRYDLNKFSSFLTYANKKKFDRHCLAKAKYIVDNLGKYRKGDGKPLLVSGRDDLI
jgi:hypothetical protein